MKQLMYFKPLSLLLLAATLCTSCGKRNNTITPVTATIAGGDTLCSLSIYKKYNQQRAQRIHVIDKHILIETPDNCGDLAVYNTETGELQSHLFKKKEPVFRYADQSSYKGTIALYGYLSHTYYEYNLDNGLISFDKTTNLKSKDRAPEVAHRLTDDLFAGIGLYRDGLLGMIDKKNKTRTGFGKYPLNEPMPLRQNEYDLLRHYRGTMDVSDDKKHIVYASETFGYISCYAFKGRKISLLWEKRLTDNLYTRKRDQLTFAPEHRKGFKDVRIINNHIYAIYDGNFYKANESNTPIPNKVLIYDFEGRQLAEYTIPQQLEYIDTDTGEKFLYATIRTANASKDDDPVLAITMTSEYTSLPAKPEPSGESYLIRYPLPALPDAE